MMRAFVFCTLRLLLSLTIVDAGIPLEMAPSSTFLVLEHRWVVCVPLVGTDSLSAFICLLFALSHLLGLA